MAFILTQTRPYRRRRDSRAGVYLVETYRDGDKVRRRYLLNLRGYRTVGDMLKAHRYAKWRRTKYRLGVLLDKLAALLVARPRSMRKLWPDADDWIAHRR